ncbi:hypothetical protein [Trinickia symbiotica]|uniref:RiboL-PSP-HEPN domain-containing protein n=1 Tax=Trinickia symbiotica TaxID=863227 RepID=A0A2N7X8G5_9BURK|nr:hypothetical protein [Trinickia symbiotica]PMS38049.1 hypothetical protein C0Z20_04400 [Trinickia symbiotica]
MEPFESIFSQRVKQILELIWVTDSALRGANGAARLASVLKHPAEAVERAREMENLAAREVSGDFPLLHSASTVLVWGALEAAFRDFLVRWFVVYPSSRTASEFNNVRVRISEYEALSGEDRMRYLVGHLEREFAAALKPGVGRFECLLKPFGIFPKITDAQRRTLCELAAVRNVIVHRAGIADSRLLELCPWLDIEVDRHLVVGRRMFLGYVEAANAYATSLVNAAKAVAERIKDLDPPDFGPAV